MFTSRDIFAKRGRRTRAFTLVELVFALTILMMLVGALYAVVDATLRGAAELRQRQDRNREITAFLSLCRKTFASMPATAVFQARVIPDGDGYSTELIFRNAPGLWWWGDAKNASSSTILGVRKQVGGLVSLGILQDSEQQIDAYLNAGAGMEETTPDFSGGTATRQWLMLLSDLRGAQWRFFDGGSASWVSEWNYTITRPAFVELTLTTEQGPVKYLFRLPPVVKVQQG